MDPTTKSNNKKTSYFWTNQHYHQEATTREFLIQRWETLQLCAQLLASQGINWSVTLHALTPIFDELLLIYLGSSFPLSSTKCISLWKHSYILMKGKFGMRGQRCFITRWWSPSRIWKWLINKSDQLFFHFDDFYGQRWRASNDPWQRDVIHWSIQIVIQMMCTSHRPWLHLCRPCVHGRCVTIFKHLDMFDWI